MIKHKRGDTLKLKVQLVDTNTSRPIDISNYTIKCQLRLKKSVYTLTPQVINAAQGTFRLSASMADTERWELGVYESDIEYMSNGEKISTETFKIQILEDITK